MVTVKTGTSEPSRIGDVASDFLKRLAPACGRYDSIAEAWAQLLPGNLRAHCRLAGARGGCLTVVADGSSYLYELQLCKGVLLRELQRLCPAARLRRLDVRMAR
jgi:hypothetical protein